MPRRNHKAAKARAVVTRRRTVSNPSRSFEWLLSTEHPAVEKIDAIRRGLRARVVDGMVEYFDVPKAVIFDLLHTPESTAHKLIRDDRPLDSSASERVVRVADVVRMAEHTFGGREAASRWLKTPNRAFRDEMPLSLLDTEPGASEVRKVLAAIDYGGTL